LEFRLHAEEERRRTRESAARRDGAELLVEDVLALREELEVTADADGLGEFPRLAVRQQLQRGDDELEVPEPVVAGEQLLRVGDVGEGVVLVFAPDAQRDAELLVPPADRRQHAIARTERQLVAVLAANAV